MRRRHRATALLLGLALATAACSGSSGGGGAALGADQLLAKAKTTVDAATSLRFRLTGTDLPDGGSAVTGGEGVAARPPSFQGTLSVRVAGAAAKVEVISVGGTFYAKLPFTTTFAVADPKTLGFSDPAGLLDPTTGVSALLTAGTATLAGQSRLDGEVLTDVDVTLPGTIVAELLTSADPAKEVTGTVGIAANGEVRRVVLTGPFFAATTQSTFTLLLDRYGDPVSIVAPTG